MGMLRARPWACILGIAGLWAIGETIWYDSARHPIIEPGLVADRVAVHPRSKLAFIATTSRVPELDPELFASLALFVQVFQHSLA